MPTIKEAIEKLRVGACLKCRHPMELHRQQSDGLRCSCCGCQCLVRDD